MCCQLMPCFLAADDENMEMNLAVLQCFNSNLQPCGENISITWCAVRLSMLYGRLHGTFVISYLNNVLSVVMTWWFPSHQPPMCKQDKYCNCVFLQTAVYSAFPVQWPLNALYNTCQIHRFTHTDGRGFRPALQGSVSCSMMDSSTSLLLHLLHNNRPKKYDQQLITPHTDICCQVMTSCGYSKYYSIKGGSQVYYKELESPNITYVCL